MVIKHIEMTAHPGGLTRLNIVVAGNRSLIAKDVNKVEKDKFELQIKRIRSKRGLTANAYYWVLVDHLAKVLGSSKDEVHEQLMQDYGTFKLNESGKPIVFTIAAGENPKDIAPYSRAFAEGYVDGKKFIHHAVLKGSSEMSAYEFGVLLDGLISECKQMGIETMTPQEIAELEILNSSNTNYEEKSPDHS